MLEKNLQNVDYKIGDLVPVWWYTGTTNENGRNVALVLDIRPYIGLYEKDFKYILKLVAPSTKRGWLEMTT